MPVKTGAGQPGVLQGQDNISQRGEITDNTHNTGHNLGRGASAAQNHHNEKQNKANPLGSAGGGQDGTKEEPKSGKTGPPEQERRNQLVNVFRRIRTISGKTENSNQQTTKYSDNDADQKLRTQHRPYRKRGSTETTQDAALTVTGQVQRQGNRADSHHDQPVVGRHIVVHGADATIDRWFGRIAKEAAHDKQKDTRQAKRAHRGT